MSNNLNMQNSIAKLLDGVAVEWKTVAEIFTLKNGYTPSKAKKEYWADGEIPWFRMEDIRENGQILNNALQKINRCAVKGGKLFPENSIIMATSATIGEHALITVPHLANQRFTNLSLKAQYQEIFDIKFLFYYCFLLSDWCKKNTTKSSFASVDMKGFKEYPIPIPPIQIQTEIIRILETFTELTAKLTAELTAELTARKRQYDYYRDKLLTFKENEVEWKTLGEIATIQRGASPRPIAKYITDSENGVPWIKIGDTLSNSKYVDNTAQKITFEGAAKSRVLKKGDFIMSNSMSYGRPYILKIDGAIHDGWASISNFENMLNSDYLYHYLSSNVVQNYWKSKINSGSVSNLNSDIIKSLKIPILTINEQKCIANTLDKFDVLTNSLTEGLPREIELRQKQYEYYRNLLLNFPKVEDK